MNRVVAPAHDMPPELIALLERARELPADVRETFLPLVEEVAEQARFRGRVVSVARDALEQFRHELALIRFDLDATRRERDELRGRFEVAS